MLREMIPWTRRLPTPLEAFDNELVERLFNPIAAWKEMEKFAPIANLAETETGYEVTLELPGMKPEEFNVEFHHGELWVSGEKKEEKEEKGKTYHRVERRYGEFRRGFRLPVPVNEEQVTAEYKEGILRVAVPKIAEALPKRIEVKA